MKARGEACTMTSCVSLTWSIDNRGRSGQGTSGGCRVWYGQRLSAGRRCWGGGGIIHSLLLSILKIIVVQTYSMPFFFTFFPAVCSCIFSLYVFVFLILPTFVFTILYSAFVSQLSYHSVSLFTTNNSHSASRIILVLSLFVYVVVILASITLILSPLSLIPFSFWLRMTI